MKKYFYLVILVCSINISAVAQAVLPTSWNFANTNLPTGWTETNVNSSSLPYYSGSGNPQPAYKFDAQGDMLTIHFASTPANMQFDIVGNPPPNGTWSGTVTVEESVNGSSWTTVGTPYTSLTTSYATKTHTLNPASRYARLNLTTKGVGNVGLDNVSISAGTSPVQEISIKQGSTTITNGATYTVASPVLTTTPTTFTIHNLGLATLNIDSVKITGINASDFSVATYPATVAGTSNSNFNLDFTPAVAGTRIAALYVYNNDATASPYIINLYGVGGNLATEPASQASNLNFTNIKSFRYNGSFTGTTPAPDGGYLVLRRIGAPVTDVPVDGIVYQRGDVIGNSKVASSTSGTGIFPSSDVIASTQYHYAIFAYNGTGIYRNYNTTAPLTGNVTTSATMQPATYYNSIATNNASFVTDLHNKVNPHTLKLYSDYGPLMIAKFYSRDTTANQRVLTCTYSGLNKLYTEPWDWTSNNFSREHTYPQSWMPTLNDVNFQNRPEYNDYHMIKPAEQNNVNAIRSNYPLGEVVGTPTYSYLGCKIGNNIYGKKVFEPRDSDKGDAARAMLYQSICYTGVSYSGPPNTTVQYGGSWALPNYISSTIPYGQDQNILKKWHYQDPPDNLEIARNDFIDSLQGNRNPFIDSVHYVCYIDFKTMTKLNGPVVPCNNSAIGINDSENGKDIFVVSPNPNKGNFTINYVSNNNKKMTIRIVDGLGRIVFAEQTILNIGYNNLFIETKNLSSGIYLLELTSDSNRLTTKLLID